MIILKNKNKLFYHNFYIQLSIILYFFLSLLSIGCTSFYNIKHECFSGNCKNGYGKAIYSKFPISYFAAYEGKWLEGKRHGKGKYIIPNSYTYEGEFINDLFEGKGKEKIFYHQLDNSKWIHIYEGNWHNGTKNGKGVYKTYKNSELYTSYDGNWKCGKKHGKGIFRTKGIDYRFYDKNIFQRSQEGLENYFFIFEGEFESDLFKEGKCIYTFDSGCKYTGKCNKYGKPIDYELYKDAYRGYCNNR